MAAYGKAEGRGVSLRLGNTTRERLPIERLVTQVLEGPASPHRDMGILWQVSSRAGAFLFRLRFARYACCALN